MSMRKRGGFSLLELVCASAIMVTVLGVMLMSSGGTVRLSARQSATGLVETELRSARERALGEQKFVAVVMSPGTGSDVGVETGPDTPRRERVTSLAKEFRGAWVKTGALAVSPSPDPRVALAWYDSSRAAVVFTPGGRMLTNLQPDASGRVVLEVGDAAHAESVLTVAPGGTVTSERKPGGAKGTLAAPLTRVEGANHPPVLESFELNTSAAVRRVDGVLVADIDPGKRLNLEVYASDVDGDEQLYSHWTGGGAWSQSVRSPMLLDRKTGKWKTSVTWQAPNPATGPMELHCEVTDRHGEAARDPAGGLATANDAFKLKVGLPLAERIVLPMDLIDKFSSICVMNPDGSGLRALWKGTPAAVAADNACHETQPVVSPDGTQVLYVSNKSWPPDLVVRNIDGTNRRIFCRSWAQPGFADLSMFWSATGDSIYYTRLKPGDTIGQLVKVQADCDDAANPPVVVNNRRCDKAYVSPDGRFMAWIHYYTASGWSGPAQLELVNLANGNKEPVLTESATLTLNKNSSAPTLCWEANSSGFVFLCKENGVAKLKRGSATLPSTVSHVADLQTGANQVQLAPTGQIGYTTNNGRAVYLHGTLAAPAAQGGAVMTLINNTIYAGAPHRIMWSQDGRYLFYVQGPGPSPKILRYDTSENSIRELSRGLAHSEPATDTGGGATDLMLLPEP